MSDLTPGDTVRYKYDAKIRGVVAWSDETNEPIVKYSKGGEDYGGHNLSVWERVPRLPEMVVTSDYGNFCIPGKGGQTFEMTEDLDGTITLIPTTVHRVTIEYHGGEIKDTLIVSALVRGFALNRKFKVVKNV